MEYTTRKYLLLSCLQPGCFVVVDGAAAGWFPSSIFTPSPGNRGVVLTFLRFSFSIFIVILLELIQVIHPWNVEWISVRISGGVELF